MTAHRPQAGDVYGCVDLEQPVSWRVVLAVTYRDEVVHGPHAEPPLTDESVRVTSTVDFVLEHEFIHHDRDFVDEPPMLWRYREGDREIQGVDADMLARAYYQLPERSLCFTGWLRVGEFAREHSRGLSTNDERELEAAFEHHRQRMIDVRDGTDRATIEAKIATLDKRVAELNAERATQLAKLASLGAKP